jgi:hypothetical protein
LLAQAAEILPQTFQPCLAHRRCHCWGYNSRLIIFIIVLASLSLRSLAANLFVVHLDSVGSLVTEIVVDQPRHIPGKKSGSLVSKILAHQPHRVYGISFTSLSEVDQSLRASFDRLWVDVMPRRGPVSCAASIYNAALAACQPFDRLSISPQYLRHSSTDHNFTSAYGIALHSSTHSPVISAVTSAHRFASIPRLTHRPPQRTVLLPFG